MGQELQEKKKFPDPISKKRGKIILARILKRIFLIRPFLSLFDALILALAAV